MFDSQKIDAYFDDKSPTNRYGIHTETSAFAWRRLVKIAFPCTAAALLGLMVVMPNIKKNVDLTDTITLPRKNEMEQLHIEQTVFNITDNKNRVNQIVAENVDEVETDAERYKILNPKGTIPTDNGQIVVTSKIGWFSQQKNELELEDSVKAVIDNNTVVQTAAARYNFDTEKGFGKTPVTAKGDWGSLKAKAFEYDKQKEILTLKGHHYVETSHGVLIGENETKIYQTENKTVTLGQAQMKKGEKTLYADKITAYFSEAPKRDLLRAEAEGNVRIITSKEEINGSEGYYSAADGKIEMFADSKKAEKQTGFVDVRQGQRILRAKHVVLYLTQAGEIERAEAFQSVKIIMPDETVSGGEGIYIPKSGRIMLYGTSQNAHKQKQKVEILQGDNALHAQRIEIFLDSKNQIKNANAFGEVEVITPKGFAWGDRGVYNPVQNKVELFDNVRLEQNGNFITGAHAETDLDTSVSRITGDATTNGRISGTFYKKRK